MEPKGSRPPSARGARTIEHASYLDAEGMALGRSRALARHGHLRRDWIDEGRSEAGLARRIPAARTVRRPTFSAKASRGGEGRRKLTFGTDAAVIPRPWRAPVRLHGPLRDEPDAGDPGGHDRGRSRSTARKGRSAAPGRRLGRPCRGSADPLNEFARSSMSKQVIKGGELVARLAGRLALPGNPCH